jgi:hypothetical protein
VGVMGSYFLNDVRGTYTINQSTGAVIFGTYPGCPSLP